MPPRRSTRRTATADDEALEEQPNSSMDLSSADVTAAAEAVAVSASSSAVLMGVTGDMMEYEQDVDPHKPAGEMNSVEEAFAIGASALRSKRYTEALEYLTRSLELAETKSSVSLVAAALPSAAIKGRGRGRPRGRGRAGRPSRGRGRGRPRGRGRGRVAHENDFDMEDDEVDGDEVHVALAEDGNVVGAVEAGTSQPLERDLAKLHMFRARTLQLQGDHQAAIEEFGRSLQAALSPDKEPCGSYILRAKSLREVGRLEEALDDYGRAAELDPNEVSIYIGRAALHMVHQRWDDALSDCQRALELDPRNVVAHRRSGLIFAETGRLPQAVRAFNRALAIRADYESLTLRGKALVQQGMFDRALADYTLAIQLQPNVPLAYGHRSVLYAHLKRLDKAINDATSFVHLAPREQCASALQNRGVWLGQLGEYERAVDDFTRVLSQQPSNAFAYMSRAMAHAQLNRHRHAIADWKRVIQLHPDMVKAYWSIAEQFAHLHDHGQAAHFYTQVVRLYPQHPAGYHRRAQALCNQERFEDSLGDWHQALRLAPDNPDLYQGRAATHLQLGFIEDALSDLAAAIHINPVDPANYERRAAAMLMNRWEAQDEGDIERSEEAAQLGKDDLVRAKKMRWLLEQQRLILDREKKQKQMLLKLNVSEMDADTVRAVEHVAAQAVGARSGGGGTFPQTDMDQQSDDMIRRAARAAAAAGSAAIRA